MKKLLFLFLTTFPSLFLSAQLGIPFKNASFEENVGTGTTPNGWFNCAFEGETKADIHGANTLYFDVAESAYDGENFVGLVTRSTGTFETIGCKLELGLKAGQTYFLQFHTSKSKTYSSPIKKRSSYLTSFNNPAIIQIYGGHSDCDMEEILAVSKPITNTAWSKQGFVLRPTTNCDYIFFSSYFPDPENPSNGNVLIDKIEPLETYTDTIRYQALCLNGEYVGQLDKQTLTPQKLKKAILAYNLKILNASNPDLQLSQIEYNISVANQLQNKLKKEGVHNYILHQKSKVKKQELQVLERIGALKEWEILSKGVNIHLQNKYAKISEEDHRFFEELPEYFLEVNAIEQRLLDYIWQHKDALLNGFGSCIN